MEKYLGLLIGFCAIMYLDRFDLFSKQDLVAISLLGWAIYIFSLEGGL